ncbi:MAG: hypothetical protein IKL40_03995 [Clostridia bacterium]|nr:hypothetical protein [Clostridia bacterium]
MAKKEIVTDKEIKRDLVTAFYDYPQTRKNRFKDPVLFLGLGLTVGFIFFFIGFGIPIFLLLSFLFFLASIAGHYIHTRIIPKNIAKDFSTDAYDISVMTVDCIRDEYYTKHGKTSIYNVYNYFIRFENGNEWNLPISLYRWSERHATYGSKLYKNTHAGDTFIVVTKKADNKIVMAYNTDIFEYKK